MREVTPGRLVYRQSGSREKIFVAPDKFMYVAPIKVAGPAGGNSYVCLHCISVVKSLLFFFLSFLTFRGLFGRKLDARLLTDPWCGGHESRKSRGRLFVAFCININVECPCLLSN